MANIVLIYNFRNYKLLYLAWIASNSMYLMGSTTIIVCVKIYCYWVGSSKRARTLALCSGDAKVMASIASLSDSSTT